MARGGEWGNRPKRKLGRGRKSSFIVCLCILLVASVEKTAQDLKEITKIWILAPTLFWSSYSPVTNEETSLQPPSKVCKSVISPFFTYYIPMLGHIGNYDYMRLHDSGPIKGTTMAY